MNIVEETSWEGRPLTVTWRDKSFVPPRELTSQASGLCFTNDGKIVLVTTDKKRWQLIGGHPQTGETVEHALIREVSEEACAMVTELSYLGSQEINDPQNPTGLTTYYQARFYARIRLGEFTGKHEIIARRCIDPSEVKSILNWRTTRILEHIVQEALEHEKRGRIDASPKSD